MCFLGVAKFPASLDEFLAIVVFVVMMVVIGEIIRRVNSIKDKKGQRIRDAICIVVIAAIIIVTSLGFAFEWF